MKKLGFLLSFILLFGLVAAQCAGLPATVVVTKEVEVEKQVLVTPTPTPRAEVDPDAVLAGLPTAEITMAWVPVWDDTFWLLAADLGYFEDAGLNWKGHRTFAFVMPQFQAYEAGELNVLGSNIFSAPTLFAEFTDLGYIGVTDIWFGFAFLARPDSGIKSYDEFIEEGMPQTDALKATLEQFRGKTIVTQLGSDQDPIVSAAFERAGLCLGQLLSDCTDVNWIDIPFPEGAGAFIRGEGDIYSGDIPGRFRVEEEGAEVIISGLNLGEEARMPLGLIATKKMPDEIALKLLGVMYRTYDTMRSDPEMSFQVMADYLSQETGADFDAEFGKWVATDISPWLPYEEAAIYFEPGGEYNFDNALGESIRYWEGVGKLKPGEVTVSSMSDATRLYREYGELKAQTEQAIAAVEAAIGGKESEFAAASRLLAEAKTRYEQRDYVDSAILAAAALEATQ